jgi:hypothetical protein
VCNEYDADIPSVAYPLHQGKNLMFQSRT